MEVDRRKSKLKCTLVKVAFFRKCDSFFKSPKTIYSKLLYWAGNLNLLFAVIGGKFKFQVQDNDLEYFFWRFEKQSALSDKNGIPFLDCERITNFQKYYEKITAIFQIEKWVENIPIRQRKLFHLEKGKYFN